MSDEAAAEAKQASARDEETLAVLTTEWESPLGIHARLGMWAKGSVRYHLMRLWREGRIDSRIEERPSGYRRVFRLLQPVLEADLITDPGRG